MTIEEVDAPPPKPIAGDRVVYCVHVRPAVEKGELAKSHVYTFPKLEDALRFRRPDGTVGAARFMFLCDACHVGIQETESPPAIAGDAEWQEDWCFTLAPQN
jgi:hypothetical protein